MPHTLPPKQCTTNEPNWTDPTLTDLSTKVRKVHIDELRSFLNAEFTRRYKSEASFTDPNISALQTEIRKVHVDELRTELGECKSGRGETGYCPEDSSGCMDFTDPVITALQTEIRGVHFREMMDAVDSLMTGCICETEQCQYCADCGYHYSYCSYTGCYCNYGKYAQGCTHTIHVWDCGSINKPSAAEHPYKSYSPAVEWDGTVPWDWCVYAPPGSNWGSPHTDWNCKCNPYNW